ncbi:hypothetical protein THAOC_22242 [Thalassiosira oceanica]|uniref:Uncharacterized protein n=1 Tax=Thalassiosira oceanica TaxID=159749 RepID=K0RXM6_THAOC|nr:hypothetical protein THAOC_22242 [Thalassiosira oceanica]|eukprot:EJK57685.1 hypothetical protein THAOC_22242 [Thalassiosira oceanica]
MSGFFSASLPPSRNVCCCSKQRQAEEEHGEADDGENVAQDNCGDEDIACHDVGGCVVGKQVYLIAMHVDDGILKCVKGQDLAADDLGVQQVGSRARVFDVVAPKRFAILFLSTVAFASKSADPVSE